MLNPGKYFFLLVPVLMTLIACTLSPQTISIRPDLTSKDVSNIHSTKLYIDVRDGRENKIIGYRGGVYATATITADENTVDYVYSEVKRVFGEMGFIVTAEDSPTINKLHINIEQLNYKVNQKKIVWGTELFASIKATAENAQRKTSVTLQDRRTKDYAKFPSIEENEAVINKLVSSLLQRLIEDQEFIQQLRE